ncbi:ribonucleoside-diphosphate reductase small chain [Armillaria borealis]|uniref:Ribonucleoside-diphosphate reductase small chain n=1 Tax=Armillaria borealis TaxID=47425 RepID=A0AA39IVL2_9AGAR|nr:ribonucleoside-diphosphate reductase small chain [Armillaria borealis]
MTNYTENADYRDEQQANHRTAYLKMLKTNWRILALCARKAKQEGHARALVTKPSTNADPLLTPSDERLIIFPLKDSEVWAFYKQQEASFWTAEEIDLSRDAHDWSTKLSDSERSFFSMILAFFALADSIVTENLLERFSSEIQLPEARFFYGFQAAMENIHSEVYSSLIETVISDALEDDRLLHGIAKFPSIAAKAKWALKWIKLSAPFPQCLIAFAAIEGIFFSEPRNFARSLLLNELICRDEGLHTEFACLLFNKLKSQLSPSNIVSILTEACDIKKAFWTDIMPTAMVGMNVCMMNDYIEFVMDRLLVTLNVAKVYNTANPFPFMEMISLKAKTNFFERRNAEYSLAGVGKQRANFKDLPRRPASNHMNVTLF